MIWTRVLDFFGSVLRRRKTHWVEISVARAWSNDMAPRLFDLDGL